MPRKASDADEAGTRAENGAFSVIFPTTTLPFISFSISASTGPPAGEANVLEEYSYHPGAHGDGGDVVEQSGNRRGEISISLLFLS